MLANMFLTQMQTAKKLPGSKSSSFTAGMGRKAGSAIGALALLLLSFVSSAQVVTISYSPAVVCEGNNTLLETAPPVGLPAGVTVTGYVFYYQDTSAPNDSAVTTLTKVSRIYPPGVYAPYVVAILSNGTRIQSAPAALTVYHKPVAGFTPLSGLVQCFKDNKSCFKNTSVQAPAPSNPIAKTVYEYGDAFFDEVTDMRDVCHSYNFTGSFIVTQRVTDNQGCFTDIALPSATPIRIKPNLSTSFKWTRRTGPCNSSDFLFTNLTALNKGAVQSYTWYFGDGTKYTATQPFSATDLAYYDTIPHTYTINGEFTPALTLTDSTGCTDSILYTNQNTTSGAIPLNIVFEIDIVTTKSAVSSSPRDSVCLGSHNSAEICFKQTPIPFLTPGIDFEWNFDDPLSGPQNTDKTTWSPCHTFTGMNTYFVKLNIISLCPGSYTYYSAVTLDDDRYLDKVIYANNDKLDDPQSTPRKFVDKRLKKDIIKLYYMHTYDITGNNADTLYAYKGRLDKPIYHISRDSFVYDNNGLVRDSFDLPPDTQYIVTRPFPSANDTFIEYRNWGYGVRVIGPQARITFPPVGAVIKPSMLNQCGPTDTVDFVNSSVYFKSRMMWRRWDFDDNFAPQCTSFSKPKAGFPPIVSTTKLDSVTFDNGRTYVKFGPDTVRMWANASQQYNNSDHYFIANGQIYGGKMNCKFSFDSLPRHSYPNWDTVYRWYAQGKDFMPWDPTRYGPGGIAIHPADTMWWGKPVYLDPATGNWSLVQNTGPAPFGLWVRIDTMALKYNNDQDLRVGEPINFSNLPDPFRSANSDGSYNVINGGAITPTTSISYRFKGTNFTINGTDLLPGSSPMTFYKYAFLRTITRCIAVRLKLQDSLNNETTNGIELDATKLDSGDCNMEATLQLPFAKADARGLAKRGRECPGASPNGPFFEMGPRGTYPGVKPSCGQTFILFNFDSLADRFDNTPCVLDGFVTYTGDMSTPTPGTPSTTPGGLSTPAFFTAPNFNQPPTVWTSPASTVIAWHYGLNAPQNRPPPADTALGWITVGVIIGSGIKDTLITGIPYANYQSQLAYYGDNSGTIPNPGIKANIDRPVNYAPGNSPVPGAPAQYNYSFSQVKNFRTVPLGVGFVDLVDIEYIDANWPKCISDTVWYHRFLRINNLTSKFDVEPVNCRLRHKGENITVYYEDSIQDEIKYSAWMWGDNTFTVDSFFYAPDSLPGLTDGYFINGVRRVRYNFDMQSGSIVLLDSTVWPVRASAIGATDGLKPGVDTATVAYNLINKCTGGLNANPTLVVVDTALMFLPVTHKFVRTSWEAENKLASSKTGDLQHLIGSVRGCFQGSSRPMTIGIIDTFDIRNSSGVTDTTYCENENVYFVDSLRYWRYDCQVTDLPNTPAVSNSAAYKGNLNDPPFDGLQIDSADFWRQDVGDPRPIQDVKFSIGYQGRIQIDTVTPERVYWDFGDGSPIDSSMRPVHRYATYGRYKVTMLSKDSLGGFDTCFRYLNISKPVAKIGFVTNIFNCGSFADFIDSSTMDPTTRAGGIDSLKGNWWWFGDNKLDTTKFEAKDNYFPKHKYLSNGLYKVKMVVETYQGCTDTTYSSVFIRGPRPEFKMLSAGDTVGCAPFKVRIINLADSSGKYVGPGGVTLPNDTPTLSTYFRFGESGKPDVIITGRRDTVEYIYDQPGEYYISAYGSDALPGGTNSCDLVMYPDTNNQPKIKIKVLNLKRDILLDKNIICKDNAVKITNNSDSLYTLYSYIIDKDTARIDSIGKVHTPPVVFSQTFTDTGAFTIIARPERVNPIIPLNAQSSCMINDTLHLRVVTPVPSFTVDTMETPKFKMTNTSDTTINGSYIWLVRKVGTTTPIMNTPYNGTNQDRDFNFDLQNDTGSYQICLTAMAKGLSPSEACEDSVCQIVKVTFTINVEIPNVFSPNNDGVNDEFKIRIEGEQKYKLMVYNRWGAKVFESGEAKTMWNGKTNNDGAECPAGVYYYIFDYQLRSEADKTRTGTITLIR